MKRIIVTVVLGTVFCCTSAFAAVKSCDELKTEIEAKLQAKGIQGYTLEILPQDQVKDQKIIGSCEGGSKKIAFSRKTSKE
jgi:hypothetical protein